MSIELLTVVAIVSFLVLLSLGLPVAFCLLGLSLILTLIFIGPEQAPVAYSATFRTITIEVFIAIPLFIFMAAVMQNSGIGSALYDMMYRWFAGLRGGLAIGTIVVCTLIAAMTGIGATGVVVMGLLAYPEMRKRGYDNSIAIGCIPAGGALGPLIPPSVLMILIGGLGYLSVGKLFMGGVFPGLLMSLFFVLYIAIRCWRQPHLAPALPVEERATWREKFVSLRGVILPIILIIAVLGSIYAGACTPSEAGGAGAFGALVCAAIYRQLNWQNLKESAFISLRVTAMVFWLVIGGTFFGNFLTMSGVSQYIGDTVVAMPVPSMVIVIVMMLIALVMGMLMDAASIVMICIPIFMPIVRQLGVDPLWFALLFTINLVTGYLTPPFGLNLFYTKGILPSEVSIADIYRSALPYCVLMIIVLIVGLLWPPLLTWLPSMMIK